MALKDLFKKKENNERKREFMEKKIDRGKRGTQINREKRKKLKSTITGASKEITKLGISAGLFYINPRTGEFYCEKNLEDDIVKLLEMSSSMNQIIVGRNRIISHAFVNDDEVSSQHARIINYEKPGDLDSVLDDSDSKYGIAREVNDSMLELIFSTEDLVVKSHLIEMKKTYEEFDMLFNGNDSGKPIENIDHKINEMLRKEFSKYEDKADEYVEKARKVFDKARKQFVFNENYALKVMSCDDIKKKMKKGIYFDDCSAGGGKLSLNINDNYTNYNFYIQGEETVKPVSQEDNPMHRLVYLFDPENVDVDIEIIYEMGTIVDIEAGKARWAEDKKFDISLEKKKRPEGYVSVPWYYLYFNLQIKS